MDMIYLLDEFMNNISGVQLGLLLAETMAINPISWDKIMKTMAT